VNVLFTGIFSRFGQKTLLASGAVNVGGGVVGIPSTAHSFVTGESVTFSGTTNYDSTYTVLASSGANQINITSGFTAETFATSDTAESGFYNLMGGRLYHKKAPQGATFPYCVYFMVSGIADRSFGDMEEETLIQFNIFSENNSATEAGNILAALFLRYDYCTLTVSGYNYIVMQRDFTVPNDDFSTDTPVHGYSVQYTTIIQKSR
jgi:hypothetical protein